MINGNKTCFPTPFKIRTRENFPFLADSSHKYGKVKLPAITMLKQPVVISKLKKETSLEQDSHGTCPKRMRSKTASCILRMITR